jgi:hypothetical protein
MAEEHKRAILLSLEEAKANGVSRVHACAMWMINRRRVVRWSGMWKRGQSLANGKPGPKDPVHRLLPAERTAVVAMAVEERYADLCLFFFRVSHPVFRRADEHERSSPSSHGAVSSSRTKTDHGSQPAVVLGHKLPVYL